MHDASICTDICNNFVLVCKLLIVGLEEDSRCVYHSSESIADLASFNLVKEATPCTLMHRLMCPRSADFGHAFCTDHIAIQDALKTTETLNTS